MDRSVSHLAVQFYTFTLCLSETGRAPSWLWALLEKCLEFRVSRLA